MTQELWFFRVHYVAGRSNAPPRNENHNNPKIRRGGLEWNRSLITVMTYQLLSSIKNLSAKTK